GHVGDGAAVTGGGAEDGGEAIAETAHDEAGGRERARLQDRPDFGDVVGGEGGDEAGEDVADGQRRLAQARAGDEDGAAGLQELGDGGDVRGRRRGRGGGGRGGGGRWGGRRCDGGRFDVVFDGGGGRRRGDERLE